MSDGGEQNGSKKNGKWPTEVLAAIVTGIFGLATIVVTSYFSGSASQSAKSAGDIALAVEREDRDTIPVGSIIASMLSPTEFYRENNGSTDFSRLKSSWILADGSTPIHGSEYHKISDRNLPPNLNGRFLRGIDETGAVDVDGTREPGSLQLDAIQNHTFRADRLNVGGIYYRHAAGNTGVVGHGDGEAANYESRELGPPQPVGDNEAVRLSNETRPKNVAVYFYLKIN